MGENKQSLWKTAVGCLLLLVILLVGAYLRLRYIETSPIRGDQSILLNIAMQFVNTGKLPLAANKSSAGIMNPPMITYLLALPLFLQATLTAVHLFQGLMGITAVAILGIYAQRLFGWRVALLAALLFAANPWAVFYSRFVWNPNPIPLFSTLLLMSLIAYFGGKRHPIHLVIAFPCLAIIAQLHLSGLILFAVLGLIFLLFWRRQEQESWLRAVAPLILGAVVFLILYIPFLMFENATGFVDLQAMATALLGQTAAEDGLGVGEVSVNLASFLLVEELTTGNNSWHATQTPLAQIKWQDVASIFGRFLFLTSLIYMMVSPVLWWVRRRKSEQEERIKLGQRKKSRQTVYMILAIWMIVPILFYVRHTVYLQNYYFLYIYPAPFLAIALLVDDGLGWIRTKFGEGDAINGRFALTQLFVLLPIILFAFWQANLFQTWFQLLAQTEIVPSRQAQYVQDSIAAAQAILAENERCDLTVLAEGGSVEGSSLSVIEPFVYPTSVRYVDAQRGFIIPAECTVYMTIANSVAEAWLQENGRLRPEQIEAGEETWRFYEVVGGDFQSEPLAHWQNGLSLISAEVEGELAPNTQLVLSYNWHVTEPPPAGTHYHFFNHLLDESGQIVTQDDAPAIDSVYWFAGDQLVTQFYLQMPPELENGRYTIMLGQYSWPDLERVLIDHSVESTYLVTTIDSAE